MESTRNITKIILDYVSRNPYRANSIIIVTSKSCEYKDGEDSSCNWLYQSNSFGFRYIFRNITNIVQKHLEPTPENNKSDYYEISITYDDNTKFVIKHATCNQNLEDLFSEIHKLIPSLEDIPQAFHTEETYRKQKEDLGGDMVNKVPYEVSKEYDID